MSSIGPEILGMFQDFITAESTAYQSYNGTGTRQNLFGAQINNSFGSSVTAQLDMVRLWQTMTDLRKTFTTSDPLNPNIVEHYAQFSDSFTSEILGALRAIGALNYGYFTQKIPFLASTDPATDFAANWNGYLTVILGDTAQMNFKGDNMSITRAVNDITYASSIGMEQQWQDVDPAMKGFYYYVYCLSVFMKNVFDTVVNQFSSSMSEAATLIVEIIETIFIMAIPAYESSWAKTLLFNEKQKAQAYIADDSETAVMQDEFKKNSQTLQKLIDDNTSALKDLQTAKGTIEADITAYQEQLAILKTDCEGYAATLAQSQAELDALTTQLTAMQTTFEEQTAALVAELTALQGAMKKDRIGFTSALSGLSTQYNEKLEQLDGMIANQIALLEALKTNSAAQIAALNEEYQAAIAKVEAMVAEGAASNILGQVAMQFQVKATQYNMALQGYYLLQQDILIAIQEQKCAKIGNSSISMTTVDANILQLEAHLLFITQQTATLNARLTDLPASQAEYVARIQTASGVGLAATNGDGASDLNPSAAEITAILAELSAGITAEQNTMSALIIAKAADFDATLESCTVALGQSANRSIGSRAAHKAAKTVTGLAQGVASLLPLRLW
jgi:hypothetical protein